MTTSNLYQSIWMPIMITARTFHGRGRRLTVAALSLLLIAPIAILTQPVDAQQPRQPLKGRVTDGFIKPDESGPSLSRRDIDRVGDPFDQSGEDAFDPPASAFQQQTARVAPPPRPLQGNIDDQGGGFQGQGMPGLSDQAPVQQQQPNNMQPPSMQPPTQVAQMRPSDPENAGEMKLAWDEWHRRVACAIFEKIQGIASQTLRHSQPLQCRVCYTITRDGRVLNVRMLDRSSSIIYNTLVMTVINSMMGSPVLQFPMGSRRMTCEKITTLAHNNGQAGFRSIIGDTETMKMQQQMMQQQMMQQQMMQQQMMQR